MSWTGRPRGLVIGEWHSGVPFSLQLIETFALSGRFKCWATEWFIRPALAELSGFVLRFGPIALSASSSKVVTLRLAPVLATAGRLRKRGLTVLRVGSTAEGNARNAAIAARFEEETNSYGIPVGTPILLQIGAAHASSVPFHAGVSTTRQIIGLKGWTFSSACLITQQTAAGAKSSAVEPKFQVITGSGAQFSFFALIDPTTRAMAIPLHRRWRSSHTGPFYQVTLVDSTSGRSIADQYEYLVLMR
jgi:hypothetical protein